MTASITALWHLLKKRGCSEKVQESVDSFAILGDSTLKSAANGSATKTAGKGNAAAFL